MDALRKAWASILEAASSHSSRARVLTRGCSPTPDQTMGEDWRRRASAASRGDARLFRRCLENAVRRFALENATRPSSINGGEQFAAFPCLNDTRSRHGRHPPTGDARTKEGFWRFSDAIQIAGDRCHGSGGRENQEPTYIQTYLSSGFLA